MRFVPTWIHGIADWLLGVLLIAVPYILGFARGGAETFVPVALGITGLIVTFFTNHEYGIVRKIPMIGHLWVDGFAGILLAASPWIFGFADAVWIPHVVLGVTEFIASLVTKTIPSDTAPEVL
jgi:hypothetical protein